MAALPEGEGVVIVHGQQRGTFLPQMWAELPTREEFFVQLKRKARLAPGFWSKDIALYRYTVLKGRA
jgi:AMMECR1 domain-containing protein